MTFSPDREVHVKPMLSQKKVLTGPRTMVGARQFHENTLYMNVSICPPPPPKKKKKKTFATILKDAILLMNVPPNMFVSHAGRRGSSSTEGIAKCTYLAT